MGRYTDSISTPILMANSGDEIDIFYADDGEQWANYFSARLNGDNYRIKSVLRNYSTESVVPEASGTENEKNKLGDSGVVCRTIGNTGFHIDSDKTNVIILSPETFLTPSFPIDAEILNINKSVFLFLGVDITDVTSYFRDRSEYVTRCHCCHIHMDPKSISDAMVEIIMAYEYHGCETEEDRNTSKSEYDKLPYPRQLNRIETVITPELNGGDRDVFFLLERPAEGDVVAVLENTPREKIPVVCVCDRLYKFTLPGHEKGEIFFNVNNGDYKIGDGSVRVLTKLDHLKTILSEEVNPLSLLASALGLISYDLDSIDTALESKLQQLSSAEMLQKLLSYEESLDGSTASEERADVMYPTLLHFAADWNLRKFCTQLLRYPGMLDAALLENKDGDDPRTLAFNKGFLDLENDLIQFVENKATDNELYILPTPAGQPLLPPKPHTSSSSSSGYVNVSYSSNANDSNYIRMDQRKTSTSIKTSVSDGAPVSPVSQISDNVFYSRSSYRDELDEIDPNIFRTREVSEQLSQSTPTKKALKVLGVNEEDIKKTKSSTLGKAYSRPEASFTKPAIDNISHGTRYNNSSGMFGIYDRSKFISQSQLELQTQIPQASKSKTRRLTSFLNKIKSKRSASDGDEHAHYFGGKKTHGSQIDKHKKKIPDNATERDSGSYSDEENGHKSSSLGKKSNKPKEFRQSDKPMVGISKCNSVIYVSN